MAARRLARAEADGRRCDQRPAGGAQAARRARARVPRAAGRDRSRSARARLPRPQSVAARTATSVRTSSATRRASCIARCEASDAKASGTSTSSSRQEEVDAAVIERQPLWNNRKHEHGPFDIIGDVHGCCDELEQLLQQLGYERNDGGSVGAPGRPKGDLRRRPRRPRAAHRRHAEDGDVDVAGRDGAVRPGQSRHQVEAEARRPRRHGHRTASIARWRNSNSETPEFRADVQKFLDGLVSHYVLRRRPARRGARRHEGRRCRGAGRPRCGTSRCSARRPARPTSSACRFATTGRPSTAGRASVVYGHTPVPEPEWLNRTINIDTGCVFGGRLTALRWPEKELVSVPALRDLRRSGSAVLADRRDTGAERAAGQR